MRTIDLKELEVIQMDVLQVLDDFCEQNDISYSLGCGTMLGAIRHKGYIPWDDDIDIYILRKDYEKLISVFPDTYKNIKLVSLERDEKWPRAYAQAFDVRTIMREEADTYEIGIGIDVYPIDEVPADEIEWKKYNKRRLLLQYANEMKYCPFRKDRSLKKNIILALCKFALLPLSQRNIGKIIDKYAKKYDGSNSGYVFECCQGMFQKRPFKRSCLEEVVKIPFEDRFFNGMKDYDSYLSNGYGNYMQLPPKEKQVSHHRFVAYWK